MINLTAVLAIIVIHWFADFLMQDEKWALGKSKNWKDLLLHTSTYSVLWSIPMCYFLLTPITGVIFVLITFIAHTLTDYFTSRIVSKKFANKQYGTSIPNIGGFTIIGID